MLKRVALFVLATAVVASGGVAHAAWTKSSPAGGSGFGKGKTLTAPGTPTLSCRFGTPTNGVNNWSLSWTSHAATGETQTVVKTDGGTQSATQAAGSATWTTAASQGTFTASVKTTKNNWNSAAATSNSFVISASNGHCP